VLLLFNDADDWEIAPRQDVLALLEILRTQSRTSVALIAGGLAVRTSAWFDAARDQAWTDADLEAPVGPAELATRFDLQASLGAAHGIVQTALEGEVSGCATAPYVLVLLARYAPDPVCTADAVDYDPNFPGASIFSAKTWTTAPVSSPLACVRTARIATTRAA
jgi:hypothetical protein